MKRLVVLAALGTPVFGIEDNLILEEKDALKIETKSVVEEVPTHPTTPTSQTSAKNSVVPAPSCSAIKKERSEWAIFWEKATVLAEIAAVADIGFTLLQNTEWVKEKITKETIASLFADNIQTIALPVIRMGELFVLAHLAYKGLWK
jgi:hypothetical protein